MSDPKKLPQLNEDNYMTWRERMKSILQQRRLWEAVDPGYDDLDDDDLDAEPRRKSRNDDALNFLKQATDDKTFYFIKKCTRAALAWRALEKVFCDFSALDIVDLLDQLFCFKKTQDMSMIDYLVKQDEMVEKLEQSGMEFTEDVKGAMLMRGLPRKEYRVFITQFRVNDEDLKDSKVRAKLLKEGRKEKLDKMAEGRSKIKKEDSESDEEKEEAKAFRTKHYSNPKKSQGQNHRKEYQPSSNGERPTQDKKPVTCFFCEGTGHVMKYCQKLKQKYDSAKKAKQATYAEGPADQETNREDEVGGSVKTVKFRALAAKKTEVHSGRSKVHEWVCDTGATHHMTPFREILTDFDPTVIGSVEVADGEAVQSKGAGTVTFKVVDEGGGWTLQLKQVIYVPDLDSNLISMMKLDEKGLEVKIKKGKLSVVDGTEVLFTAENKYGDAYLLECKSYETSKTTSKIKEDCQESYEPRAVARRAILWHDRLGHMSSLPPACKQEHIECCSTCVQGKMCKRKFPVSSSRAKEVLDLVHSDVVGKIPPKTQGKNQYVVTFLDDHSRFSEVELMKTKDEVLKHFKTYVKRTEDLHKKKVKILMCDNGKEYVNKDFEEFAAEENIQFRHSTVRTPQQNGRAERLNRTLFNIVRCLLIPASLPKYFWGEAIKYENYIRNRCPSKAISGEIPYEVWFKGKLTTEELEKFKIFGCRVWSLIKEKISKMDERAEECIFMGLEPGVKGFRLWSLRRQKIIISRDVIFEEKTLPYKNRLLKEIQEPQKSEDSALDWSIWLGEDKPVDEPEEGAGIHQDYPVYRPILEDRIEDREYREERRDDDRQVGEDNNEVFERAEGRQATEAEDIETPQEPDPPLRRSQRIKTEKPTCTLPCCAKKSKFEETLDVKEAPSTIQEMCDREDKELWLLAMSEEMKNHWTNQTWKIVPRPRSSNVVGSRWVFCVKTDPNGTVRRKARLVAQGYSQRFGIDYFEIFSPVINKDSLRLLIALSVNQGWEIHQLDIVAAYLNGRLQETVFMEQPALWEEGEPNAVCLLDKSIYGLHQSGRAWNDVLVQLLKEIGLTQCVSDPCVFDHPQGCVGVYVDDMILCGNVDFLKTVKHALSKDLNVKDLGPISTSIGIRVGRPDCDYITLDQCDYIRETLRVTSMLDCKGVDSPGSTNLNETLNVSPFPANTYRKIIGRLLYISTCTRPDIAFIISHLSKFCNSPTEGNWISVKRVLRYLKQTESYRLVFSCKADFQPVVYCDSDYANDPNDSVSVGGYVVLSSSGAIAWRSRKQACVATSTTIAEYYSLYEACREVVWLREFSTRTKDPPIPTCDHTS